MKIIHIIVGLDIGGAELMLKQLVVDSQRHNQFDRHSVISLTSVGMVGKEIQNEGVEVYALGMKSLLDVPIIFWRLFSLIRASSCDEVQTWMYHSDLLGGLAARLAGCQRIVWGIRNTCLPSKSNNSTRWVRLVCAGISRWVPTAIVCVAESAKQFHINIGYDPQKMTVIRNGYNFDRLLLNESSRNRLRKEWGVPEGSLIIGSVGRFDSLKDPGNFVAASGLIAINYSNIYFQIGRAHV